MITMMISAIENDFQREFITEIYKKYYSAMLKKAFSLLDNTEDAEELVQEVFADLIARVDSVMTVEQKKLPAYLMSAVKYCAYDENRKQSRWHFVDIESEEIGHIPDDGPIPEELYLKTEAIVELKSALEKIPEKYKNLLEFKYILGLSDSELSAKFKISEGAVRTSLMRARRKACSVMREGEENGI
ncbi:MAG: sigma-70 family RNA polymerase sigma factor [Oscillospiraceae bacterium]|nr:sigma-70 family RNA polymerase sigma factor [Oscillospiraceae bacterium]